MVEAQGVVECVHFVVVEYADPVAQLRNVGAKHLLEEYAAFPAALLNTIAAGATTSYLAVHAAARGATATVPGFTGAMIWGTAILLAAAVPVAAFINAKAPARRR